MSKIIETAVRDIMNKNFLNYAMSVIVSRSLPDVRDGLKPVHRRILYAMYEAGNTSTKAYKKSARMVGDVLGKYHPHGDSSVYEAAVILAQPFSTNVPLIDGQGNFGSIDGDSAAAMRYTEMRLAKISDQFFIDIKKETVSWNKNYDGSEIEPSVLTASFPNLLMNGTEGIAVGMASKILPHNFGEVIDFTKALIANPQAETRDLFELLKAPDFPSGGIIYNIEGFVSAIDTGKGAVRVRSKWKREASKRSVDNIVITEIPFKVNKANLISSIAGLVKEGKIEDISDIRDESSDKDGEPVRIVIELKRTADPDVVYAQLLKLTDLDVSYSYNCTVINEGRPEVMGLKAMALAWIAFRKETVLKRYLFERKEWLAKLHIFEGYEKAISKMDEVIETIRASSNGTTAKAALITLLDIDEIQAQAILDLRLQKLTGLELDNIKEELDNIRKAIEILSFKIDNPSEIESDIVLELDELKSRYAKPRVSEIGQGMSLVNMEDMIEREEVLITLSESGYIKRLKQNALSAQNRGTRGKSIMKTNSDDKVANLYQVNSHDTLLVFGQSGQVYGIKAYQIPEAKPTDKGRHIKNIIEGFNESINAIVAVKEGDEESTVMTVTKKGTVKRSLLANYTTATRKGGILGVNIKEGDELLESFVCGDSDHVMLVSSSGRAVRFEASKISVVGRTSQGVRGIKLDDDHNVCGVCIIKDGDTDDLMLTVSENGFGKLTKFSEFPVKGRAGKGMTAYKTTEKTGSIAKAIRVNQEDFIVIFASNGVSNKIKAGDVSIQGRATSGAKLMNIEKGHKVIAVTRSGPEDEEDLVDEQSDTDIISE
ncbi:MAG: DNA gyrase subunit A [Methyloprofundus sp.]|nr:DNA gyrase subunit A [Methyloprofundus sp.]